MTRHQRMLLRKARSSLRAAELLAHEGLFDFAVSRAFDTMFYVGRALLPEKRLTDKQHWAVVSAFGQYLANPALAQSEFHMYLLDGGIGCLFEDYDAHTGLPKDAAMEQLQRAHQFLDIAARLIGPLPSLA